ncbi:uncharacterized protein LOC142234802 isoform X2 [Haematobia irritans]|uniref:uncharacterized protein LOC142234802 isoform X2 n=1 Tax=Haematobia irritans TaxID=7368 RepID=UPI003F50B3E8
MHKFCVVCKAIIGGRAIIFSFRPHNKTQWCSVLGLDPNKIHSKHGVCSDHFLSYTERTVYGNPTEKMETMHPIGMVQPSPFVESNSAVKAGGVEGPIESFNENTQEYVPETEPSGKAPDNNVQNLYFTHNEFYESTCSGTRPSIREILNSRLVIRAIPGMYPQVKEILTLFAESLPVNCRKVCLSYEEINVTADINDDSRSCRVFALNGIGSDWQCVLRYDIIQNDLNTIEQLNNAIAQCIYVGHECGFDVCCVSANQCPLSQKFYSNCQTFNCDNFEAKYLPELSACNPLNKRIWFIPDMTHLLIGVTRAILANGGFEIGCDLIIKAKDYYPEACTFRPGHYYFGLRDMETVKNVFSNRIINKIKEIEPDSEANAKTVEFMERTKSFIENFCNLSRYNYESVLKEWILFFNSHGCYKIECCLSALKFVAEEFFNSNEEIDTIDTRKCSIAWIEQIFFYIRNYPFTSNLTLDAFQFHIGRLFSSYVAKRTVRVQLCTNYIFLLNEMQHYNIKTSYLQQ